VAVNEVYSSAIFSAFVKALLLDCWMSRLLVPVLYLSEI
jgi:hypothetical protein